MRSIPQRLLECVKPTSPEEPIRDVRIGLGYTAVQLESGSAGLAYTFHRDLPEGCTVFRGLRPPRGGWPRRSCPVWHPATGWKPRSTCHRQCPGK